MHRLHHRSPAGLVLYLATALLVLPAIGGAAGCAGNRPASEAAIKSAYPADAPYGPDIDVVVVRDGSSIRLVNREARAFGPGELWLNGGYMLPVQTVNIGTDNHADLTEFRNRFGEHYPVGTFLRPDRSQKLVLAELYDPRAKTRYRLTVQPEKQPRTN